MLHAGGPICVELWTTEDSIRLEVVDRVPPTDPGLPELADARAALKGTNEEFLKTKWRLLAAGQVALETPRYEMIRDTINHWAHHRGQMTVYLRLMGAKVPALYGPSADDKRF